MAAIGAGNAGVALSSIRPTAAAARTTQVHWLSGAAGAKLIAVGAAFWLLGGATGAAVYRAFRPQEVRVVYVGHPVPVGIALPEPHSATSAKSMVEPVEPSSASRNARAKLDPSGENSDLAHERPLLDDARAANARGEPEQALALTARHARQFPHGKLSEEREALAIRALVALNRGEEARKRAEQFRVTYPESFLIPALDAALSGP
jgi:hypothetical protein